jgi:hypothetical protein
MSAVPAQVLFEPAGTDLASVLLELGTDFDSYRFLDNTRLPYLTHVVLLSSQF